jgi:hypothetical protein
VFHVALFWQYLYVTNYGSEIVLDISCLMTLAVSCCLIAVIADGTSQLLTSTTGRVRVKDGEILIIVADITDSAFYVCNATNSVGFDAAIAQLKVFG